MRTAVAAAEPSSPGTRTFTFEVSVSIEEGGNIAPALSADLAKRYLEYVLEKHNIERLAIGKRPDMGITAVGEWMEQ